MLKKRNSKILFSMTLLLFAFLYLSATSIPNAVASEGGEAVAATESAEHKPAGKPAPKLTKEDYPQFSFSSREAIWIVAQLHLFFAAFIVGVPMFVIVIEGVSMASKDPATSQKYDHMAHDFMKISITAFSVTAILGGLLAFLLIVLYPDYFKYLSGVFGKTMLVYALLFFAESVFLYIYYYGWDAMQGPFAKWLHLSCGLLLNVAGLTLMCLSNSWVTFAMAPSGVDFATGAFLGDTWAAMRGPLWNPVNLHRLIANVAYGGAIVAAYSGYRYLASETQEEREYYDWMGYTAMLVSVSGMLPLPFAGYWLMKEVYAYSQQMGISLMGGLFAWLFIIQALLIGAIFFSINYYLWLGMGRVRGVKGYKHYVKYMCVVLVVSFAVWFTPHSIVMTGNEMKTIGAAHHHYLGYFGVMSAKNTAVNIMICTTALCFLLFRRGNKIPTVSWAKQGNAFQVALFTAAAVNIIALGVYGYFLPANVRIGLSIPQVSTTFFIMIFSAVVDSFLYKNARVEGKVVWGDLPNISQYVLMGLAISFTWLMGLMGYVRSGVRQFWHVYAVMKDTSVDAFTPPLGYAANIISITVVIFTFMVMFVFWLAELSKKKSKPAEDEGAIATETA